jgi:hypothetical protein
MECVLASLQPFLDEGKQHTILFVRAVKEGAHVAVPAEG